jgi:histidinol-phosphate aminotransferase
MLPDFARMNAARPIAIPLGPQFELDPEQMLQTGARVIYLCSPNNPTGTAFDQADMMRIADGLRGGAVLLIDEAYAEYDRQSLAVWAAASSRVIVLRTLSKAYGLAGLRVGYALGPADLIMDLEKSRGPFKVGGLAEAIAVAAIERDGDWVREIVRRTRENRERLAAALADLGLRCWPSAANFILVAAPGGDARGLRLSLRRLDIGVRAFPDLPQTGGCIRVTVGPWPLMERFLSALKEVIGDARVTD